LLRQADADRLLKLELEACLTPACPVQNEIEVFLTNGGNEVRNEGPIACEVDNANGTVAILDLRQIDEGIFIRGGEAVTPVGQIDLSVDEAIACLAALECSMPVIQ